MCFTMDLVHVGPWFTQPSATYTRENPIRPKYVDRVCTPTHDNMGTAYPLPDVP